MLAVNEQNEPITDLKTEDLRLRINGEERKVFSVSSAGAAPKTIGLFFDVSGSRRRDPLVASELAATANFLKSVWHEHDVGFVISFADQAYTETSPTDDLSQLIAGLHKIPAVLGRGSTAIYDALCSIHIPPSPAGRGETLNIVVSDFGDNASRRTEQEMIERMQSEGVRVFPLLIQGALDKPRELSEAKKAAGRAAEKTGGDVLLVQKEKDLSPAFSRLSNELQAAYRLDYEPLPAGTNRKKVQIETTRKNVRLFFVKY